MSTSDSDCPDLEHLHDVSIDTLNLSAGAIRALKSVSIVSVGGCIDAFELWKATLVAPQPALHAMITEVIPKLKELGYWFQDE